MNRQSSITFRTLEPEEGNHESYESDEWEQNILTTENTEKIKIFEE